MFCYKCGAQLEEGTKFCCKCGAAIEDNLQADVGKNENKKKKKSKILIVGLLLLMAGSILYHIFGAGYSKTLKAYVKFAKEYDIEDDAEHSYELGLDAVDFPYLIVTSFDEDENFKENALYTYQKGKVVKIDDWDSCLTAYSDGIVTVQDTTYQIKKGKMQKIYQNTNDERRLYCDSEEETFQRDELNTSSYKTTLKEYAKKWYQNQDVDLELLDYISELRGVGYQNAFLSFTISNSCYSSYNPKKEYLYSAQDLEDFVHSLIKKSAKKQDSFMQALYDYRYSVINSKSEKGDSDNSAWWSEYAIYRNSDILLEMDCINELDFNEKDLAEFLTKGNIETIKEQTITSVDIVGKDWSWKYDLEWLQKKGVIDTKEISQDEKAEYKASSSVIKEAIKLRKKEISNKEFINSLRELIKEKDRVTAGKENFASYSQKYACKQCGAIKECVNLAYVCSNQDCEKYKDDRKRKIKDSNEFYSEEDDEDYNYYEDPFNIEDEYLDSLATESISCGDKTVVFKVKKGYERDEDFDEFTEDSSSMYFWSGDVGITISLYKDSSSLEELEEALIEEHNWEYSTVGYGFSIDGYDVSGVYTCWYDDLIENKEPIFNFELYTKLGDYVYKVEARDESGACCMKDRETEYLAPFFCVTEEYNMKGDETYSEYDLSSWEGTADYLLSGITLGDIPEDVLYVMGVSYRESEGIDVIYCMVQNFLYELELSETDLSAYEDAIEEGNYDDILDMTICGVYEMNFG